MNIYSQTSIIGPDFFLYDTIQGRVNESGVINVKTGSVVYAVLMADSGWTYSDTSGTYGLVHLVLSVNRIR